MNNLEIRKIRFTYDEWQTITKKEYSQKIVHSELFSGKLAKIRILEVAEPQYWHYSSQAVKVCDAGMTWVIAVPDDTDFSVMIVLDEDLAPVVWYFDVIDSTGTDADGVFYYLDMFLDEIVYPDGAVFEDDLDQLEKACQMQVISKAQYDKVMKAGGEIREWTEKRFEDFEAWSRNVASLV